MSNFIDEDFNSFLQRTFLQCLINFNQIKLMIIITFQILLLVLSIFHMYFVKQFEYTRILPIKLPKNFLISNRNYWLQQEGHHAELNFYNHLIFPYYKIANFQYLQQQLTGFLIKNLAYQCNLEL